MPHGYNNFIVILLYSLKGNFLKFFSYNVKMAKNIKISEDFSDSFKVKILSVPATPPKGFVFTFTV